MRSSSARGHVLIRAVVVVAVAVAVWIGGQRLFASEESRIAAGIDAARTALVEGRPDDFLGVFAPDVAYQTSLERSDLEGAVEAWKRSGLRNLNIVSQEIEVDGDRANGSLVVVVGPVLRGIAVNVDLRFRKREGRWLVTDFRWRSR